MINSYHNVHAKKKNIYICNLFRNETTKYSHNANRKMYFMFTPFAHENNHKIYLLHSFVRSKPDKIKISKLNK